MSGPEMNLANLPDNITPGLVLQQSSPCTSSRIAKRGDVAGKLAEEQQVSSVSPAEVH